MKILDGPANLKEPGTTMAISLGAVLFVLTAGTTLAAPIPLMSSLTLNVLAYECDSISCSPTLGQQSSGLDSQTTTLNPLVAMASVSLAPSLPGVNGSESWTASFTNAAQGAVSLESLSLNAANASVNFNLANNGFLYSFVADASGDLVVQSMSLTSATIGGIGFAVSDLDLVGLAQGLLPNGGQYVPANGAGTVTFPVVAGTVYTLSIDDVSNFGGAATVNLQHSADFTFTITSGTSVPEPSTLIMFSIAFVALGFARFPRGF